MTWSDLEKPADEPQKPYEQILLGELEAALSEFHRPTLGLLLSSLSGGLDVSFSLLMMAAMHTLTHASFSSATVELLVANMYAVGFIFVVVGRSELFTEHTSRALFPVFAGYASWPSLARLWALIYAGNLLGTAAFAAILAFAGPGLGILDDATFAALSRPLVERNWWLTLVSSGLAGWLMGLLAWLVSACRDTISQIVLAWLVATAIGFAHLPHSIVGSGEVLLGVFAGKGTTCWEFAYFLAFTTLGNSIGGAVFVAVLKHGHSTRGADQSESESAEPKE